MMCRIGLLYNVELRVVLFHFGFVSHALQPKITLVYYLFRGEHTPWATAEPLRKACLKNVQQTVGFGLRIWGKVEGSGGYLGKEPATHLAKKGDSWYFGGSTVTLCLSLLRRIGKWPSLSHFIMGAE